MPRTSSTRHSRSPVSRCRTKHLYSFLLVTSVKLRINVFFCFCFCVRLTALNHGHMGPVRFITSFEVPRAAPLSPRQRSAQSQLPHRHLHPHPPPHHHQQQQQQQQQQHHHRLQVQPLLAAATRSPRQQRRRVKHYQLRRPRCSRRS